LIQGNSLLQKSRRSARKLPSQKPRGVSLATRKSNMPTKKMGKMTMMKKAKPASKSTKMKSEKSMMNKSMGKGYKK
jgi:hypothetical protein